MWLEACTRPLASQTRHTSRRLLLTQGHLEKQQKRGCLPSKRLGPGTLDLWRTWPAHHGTVWASEGSGRRCHHRLPGALTGHRHLLFTSRPAEKWPQSRQVWPGSVLANTSAVGAHCQPAVLPPDIKLALRGHGSFSYATHSPIR